MAPPFCRPVGRSRQSRHASRGEAAEVVQEVVVGKEAADCGRCLPEGRSCSTALQQAGAPLSGDRGKDPVFGGRGGLGPLGWSLGSVSALSSIGLPGGRGCLTLRAASLGGYITACRSAHVLFFAFRPRSSRLRGADSPALPAGIISARPACRRAHGKRPAAARRLGIQHRARNRGRPTRRYGFAVDWRWETSRITRFRTLPNPASVGDCRAELRRSGARRDRTGCCGSAPGHWPRLPWASPTASPPLLLQPESVFPARRRTRRHRLSGPGLAGQHR